MTFWSNWQIDSTSPSVLKIVKKVPVFRKYCKLGLATIALLSNIEKIHEKLVYKRPYTFLNNKNIICDLQFR